MNKEIQFKLKHLCFVLCLPSLLLRKKSNKQKNHTRNFHHSHCIYFSLYVCAMYVCMNLGLSVQQKHKKRAISMEILLKSLNSKTKKKCKLTLIISSTTTFEIIIVLHNYFLNIILNI